MWKGPYFRFMKSHFSHPLVLIGSLSLLLVGCTFLPSSGPSLSRVKSSAHKKNHGSYTLVPISKKVLGILNNKFPPAGNRLAFSSGDTLRQAPSERKSNNDTRSISILGDIKTPSLIPLSQETHLLDIIAQAGGSLGKEYDTIVTVNRDSLRRSALLSEIYESPLKNISLQSGDSIIVRVRAEHFLSFGANGKLNTIPFNNKNLTLDEALAMIGGPDNNAANPSAILIYRLEPQSVIREIGLKVTREETNTIPIIYRLDLTQAEGFFLAHNFKMKDQDIIYTTAAGSMGLLKFFHLLGGIFAPVTQVGGVTAATVGAAAVVP